MSLSEGTITYHITELRTRYDEILDRLNYLDNEYIHIDGLVEDLEKRKKEFFNQTMIDIAMCKSELKAINNYEINGSFE
jgi:hypothetical protein